MKQLFFQTILFTIISLSDVFAAANDQTIPAPQPQYTIIMSRSSSCYRNDLWCREDLGNRVIKETQEASVNYCKTKFNNTARVLNWNADCRAFFVGEMNPPVPPPPQMPDLPQTVTCQAQVDFVCE